MNSRPKIARMTTTTLQFIMHTFRPKFLYLKPRQFSVRTGNSNNKIQNGSSFLVKFLEDGNYTREVVEFPSLKVQKSRRLDPSEVPRGSISIGDNTCSNNRKNFDEGKKDSSFFTLSHSIRNIEQSLHSYDPVYLIMKPFTPTADDILAIQDESLLENSVISRNNYTVTVLSNPLSYPPGLFEPTFKYTPLTDFEKCMIDAAGKVPHEYKSNSTTSENVPGNLPGKPDNGQLENVFINLSHSLPRFFVQAHDYSIYSPEILFNNNIRGVTTKGMAAYVQQLALVRIVGHLKFAHVRLDVLKITKHPEDGTIRVRWRIRGMSAMKVFLNIWKVRFWNWKKLLEQESDWYDGFSIFFVGSDGLVYRHDCDKMIPDDEKKVETTQTLAAKLALLIGVLQRPVLDDLNTVMMALLKMEGINSTNPPIAK